MFYCIKNRSFKLLKILQAFFLFGKMEEYEEVGDFTPFEYQQPKTCTKRNDLFLNTNGTCFLCLKQLNVLSKSNGNEDDQSDEMSEVSLREICRYLGIDPCSILLRTLKGSVLNDKESESRKEKCDFSVPLCLSCSSITGKLSKLLREIELAKLQVNYQLHKVQQILRDAQSRENCTQENFGLNTSVQKNVNVIFGDSLEGRLVGNLRYETSKKCSAKLQHIIKTDFPRIQLRPLKSKFQVHQQSLSSSLSENSQMKCSSIVRTTIQSQRKPTSSNKCATTPVSSLSEPATKNFVLLTCIRLSVEVPSSTNSYYCLVCNNPKELLQKFLIHKHLINVHPEEFFHQLKPPNLSEDAFKICCREALASGVSHSKTWMKQSIFSEVRSPALVCKFCTARCPTAYLFKHHFVLEHYSIVENNLRAQIQNFLFNEKHKGEMMSSINQEQNAQNDKLIGLSKFIHIQQPSPLLPFKNSPMSSVCLGKNLAVPNRPSSHATVTSLQTTIDSSSPDNVAFYPTAEQFVLATIAKLSKVADAKNHFHCLVCTLKDIHPINIIDKHLINVHPEKFFLYKKPPNLSETTFQICCREVLSTEITESRLWMRKSAEFSTVKHPVVVCRFCQQRLSNPYYFKHHLTLKHHSIVELKIATDLREYTLKEKKKIGFGGEVSGQNFPNSTCTEPLTERRISTFSNNTLIPMPNVLIVPKNEYFSEWICSNCEEGFESEMELINHNKYTCLVGSDPLESVSSASESQDEAQGTWTHLTGNHPSLRQRQSSFNYVNENFEHSYKMNGEATQMLYESQNYNEMLTSVACELNEENFEMEVEYNDMDVKEVATESN